MDNRRTNIIKCLHPITTLQGLKVPCGRCYACLMKRSMTLAKSIRYVTSQYKYNFFVYLSYEDKFLPRVSFDVISDDYIGETILTPISVPRVSYADRNHVQFKNTILHEESTLQTSEDELRCLREHYAQSSSMHKASTEIPVLSRKDIGTYIKNLKQAIRRRLGTCDLSYYVCGEYGPSTLRPHYHAILSTNSEELTKGLDAAKEEKGEATCEITRLCRALWRYGYVGCEVSRGKCSSYISSYVASNSLLPRVLLSRQFKPFVVRKHGYAKQAERKINSHNKPLIYSRTCPSSDALSSVSKPYYPTYAREVTEYPKCPRYALLSTSQKYVCYRLYHYLQTYYDCRSLLNACKLAVMDYFLHRLPYIPCPYGTNFDYLLFTDNYFEPYKENPLVTIFKLLGLPSGLNVSDASLMSCRTCSDLLRYQMIIYRAALASRNTFLYAKYYKMSHTQYINDLITYYNSKQYANLSNSLSILESLSNYEDLPYVESLFYDNIEPAGLEIEEYQATKSYYYDMFYSSVKHQHDVDYLTSKTKKRYNTNILNYLKYGKYSK